jgi:hypothetical protein
VSSRPVKGISTRSLPDRAAAAAIRLTNFHGLAVGIDCLGHRQSRLAVFRGFVQATKENRDDDDKSSVLHETAVGAGDRSRLLISVGFPARIDAQVVGATLSGTITDASGAVITERPSVDQEFGER